MKMRRIRPFCDAFQTEGLGLVVFHEIEPSFFRFRVPALSAPSRVGTPSRGTTTEVLQRCALT